eukprot:TRINITY_DN1233_c0_g1_i2.p3 TRINITY_DN1233_c0_g1~~TRINITY_DN1233_c0_g1_i2.p3  ORF type:complete len:105 (+),score=1.20 TRINITY_DN1233_c0_g1_i2:809-1123(+)
MKKNMHFVLAGMTAMFATAAMAGGPEPMQAPAASAAPVQHHAAASAVNPFYVGGGLGFGRFEHFDQKTDSAGENDVKTSSAGKKTLSATESDVKDEVREKWPSS